MTQRAQPAQAADVLAPLLVGGVVVAVVAAWIQRGVYIAGGWVQHGTAPKLLGIGSFTFLSAWAKHPTDPVQGMPAAARDHAPSSTIFVGLDVLALVILVAIVVGAGWLVLRFAGGSGSSDRTTGWASRREIRELAIHKATEPGRIVLGSVGRTRLATRPEQSLLVFGPTRSGKTSRIAIPAIKAWQGPAIVVSTKTDLALATYQARRQFGDVAVFDPTGATGLPAAGWSPIPACSNQTEARRMADRFVRMAGTTDGMGSAFWTATAGQLLAPLLHAAALAEGTMLDVARWVRIGELREPDEILTDAGVMEMAEAVRAVRSQDPRLRDSTLATLRTVLAAYDDLELAGQSSDIGTDWLLSGDNTLFIVGSSDDQRRLAPVFLALIGTIVEAAYRRTETIRRSTGRPESRLDPPLLLLLDEAAHMAPIPEMSSLASTAGGMGVQLLSVFQDRSQLRRIYGHDAADSICNAHTVKLALRGLSDPDTLTYLTRLSGRRAQDQAEPGARQTDPLVPEHEASRLPRGKVLAFPSSGRPMKIELAQG